ncbi:MAG: cation-transporting P-type ATPase, partial [Planctomycetaceae bacterium]
MSPERKLKDVPEDADPQQRTHFASIAQPWTGGAADVLAVLNSDGDSGLTEAEAHTRLETHGPNRIRESRKRGPLKVFLGQFADLMIGLLVAAAFISAIVGDWTDAVLIALIVLANAVVGFVQEWRAERAVAALKSLTQPHARVRRGGRVCDVNAERVVPGDLLELNTGEFVPADARLLSIADLEVDEAPLTGESLPVEKSA